CRLGSLECDYQRGVHVKKKRIVFIFSIIATVTIALLIAGLIFNKTEEEKMNGLTEIFDVSPDGMIAYVAYHEGQQHIVLKTEREEQLALDVNKEKVILDIAFSP